MNAYKVLQKIESISGSNEKKRILKKYRRDDLLRFLLETSLNPFYNYGVNKFDDGKVYANRTPSLDELKRLRKSLVERKLTGHAARDAMRNTLLCENKVTRKWLIRCFRKSIRSGTSHGHIEKIFPGLIPKFDLGKCKMYSDDKFKGKFYVEPKYDGFRCITFIDANGIIKFVSRNKKPIYNVEHIEKELGNLKHLAKHFGGIVYDGEMLAKNWNETAKIIRKETPHPNAKTLSYYIFDMMLLDEWNKKKSDWLTTRKYHLLDHLAKLDGKYVKSVPFKVCTTKKEMKKFYKRCLKFGFEGVILKKYKSEYPFGRSSVWLKYKPVQTYDVKIVGVREGKGKYENTLGSFICRFNNGLKNFRVGSGIPDELRKKYWKKRNRLKGKYVEIECQEITKKKVARFPVFMRLRIDK